MKTSAFRIWATSISSASRHRGELQLHVACNCHEGCLLHLHANGSTAISSLLFCVFLHVLLLRLVIRLRLRLGSSKMKIEHGCSLLFRLACEVNKHKLITGV